MAQKRGVGFLGLLIFWAVGAAVCLADFGTVDVLKPYSDLIVVDQGDEFWLTCSSDPAISSVAADIGAESYGVPIKPSARVPVKFEKPGEHPIVVYVDGYPDRTLKVQVMPKLFLPPAGNSQKTLSASASGIRIGMGSLYAGYYVNACDGTTGHKWPFRIVANQACTVNLRILSGGRGDAWSGSVVAGDNIVVVNNPTGDQWVLSPFVGGEQVGGTQTINTNTPYRLGITNIILTTNTLSHTAGTAMAGLQTLALVNDRVTWRVEPNCWWTFTNACADLFRWTGPNLAASGLTNGAAYTNAGLYQVKVYCHTDLAGKSAEVAVLGLDTLKLGEAADLSNTKQDSTQSDSTPSPNTLFLPEQFPGPTGMRVSLSWIPGSTSIAGSWMKWKIVTVPSNDTPLNWSANSGDFSSQPVDLTWATNAAPAERKYKIEAWFDRNLNGVCDTGEPHRMLRITVMKVEIKARNGVDPAPEHLGVNSTNRFKAVVSPAIGGTYAWTTTSAKMALVLASSQTVRVDAGADPSASMDAEELKVAFTPSLETVSCEDIHDLTLVKMDIDGDSNHDGSITDADETSEETAPGVVVGLNDDDDDRNGVVDREETGVLGAPDDDLVWIEMNGKPADMDEGTVVLQATRTGTGDIRAWFCTYKGMPLYIDTRAGQTTYTWTINGTGGDETISSLAGLPTGMALEGVKESSAAGNVKLTLTFKRTDGTVLHKDAVVVTVVKADVDVDSDNDGTVEDTDDPIELDAPGKLIYLNHDDDNKNDVEDRTENAAIVAGENDLQRLRLAVAPIITGGTVTLSAPTGATKCQVWKSASKGPAANRITLPRTWTLGTDAVPTTLHLEGIDTGEIYLRFVYKVGSVEVSVDEVRLAVLKVDFKERANTVYGYDDGTTDDNPVPTSGDNPPQKYDWINVDQNSKTTVADVEITPASHARWVHFVVSDTAKAACSPSVATASPQTLTITGKAVGKTWIRTHLGTVTGAQGVRLNVGSYKLAAVEASFNKVKTATISPDGTTAGDFETGANGFMRRAVSHLTVTDNGTVAVEYDDNANTHLDIDGTNPTGGAEWTKVTTAVGGGAGLKLLHVKSFRYKNASGWITPTGMRYGDWLIVSDASVSKERTTAHEVLHNKGLRDTGPSGKNTKNIMYYAADATKYFVGMFKIERVKTGTGTPFSPQQYQMQWDAVTR